MFRLRLGLLSYLLLKEIHGYQLNQNDTSPSLHFNDVQTKISLVSHLFLHKESAVSVEGLPRTVELAQQSSSILTYTIFMNNEARKNGTVTLQEENLDYPYSAELGSLVVDRSGRVDLRVVLSYGGNETSIETVMRVYSPWLVMLPIVIALVIFLVVQVPMVSALFTAILVGSWIIEGSLVQGFQAIFNTHLLKAASNPNHVSLVMFIVYTNTLMTMMQKSGGTNELLRTLSPNSCKARAAQVIVFILGVLIFFDPFVSMLVVGKIFGTVLKGFPISRDKIAFLVDTTGLPVSSIVPGSTWTILVSAFLKHALEDINPNVDGKSIVMSSIKYQFYPILLLAMTMLQIVLSREAGPLLARENDERLNYGNLENELENALSAVRRETTKPERSWNWLFPVLTMNILFWAAYIRLTQSPDEQDQNVSIVGSTWVTTAVATILLTQAFFLWQPRTLRIPQCFLTRKNQHNVIFLTQTFPSGSTSLPCGEDHVDADFGDIIHERPSNDVEDVDRSGVLSDPKDILSCCRNTPVLSLNEGIDCFFVGTKSSVETIFSLILSWTLSEVYFGMGIDSIVAGWILNSSIPLEALPVVGFVSGFVICCLLGSSWVAASVLIPTVSMPLLQLIGPENDTFGLVLGSILSGIVAGDHIGPFSETTIISAFATECDAREHFLTQAPYSIFVMLLSILVGTLPLSFQAYPDLIGFSIGLIIIFIFVVIICRRVKDPKFIPGRRGDAITKELHPLQKGFTGVSHGKYLPDGTILPVDTDDFMDRGEDQTVAHLQQDSRSTMEPGMNDGKKEDPPTVNHTLQSLKNKLQGLNSDSSDPILGLMEDGILSSEVKNAPGTQVGTTFATQNPKTAFEDKKRMIEATIQSSEKEGNIFSESLRMFLRSAETKLGRIKSEGSIDIAVSKSGDSRDDSLDNLMLEIAAKVWKSSVDVGDDGEETNMSGIVEAYTTGEGYTTDGVGSEIEESDCSSPSSASSPSSSSACDGQSTAFTSLSENSDSNMENTSTGTSNAPSLTASEATTGLDKNLLNPSVLMKPLAFSKSHNVFAWIGGQAISSDDTETHSVSSKDYTKASF